MRLLSFVEHASSHASQHGRRRYPQRRSSTSWQPGQSGNPLGTRLTKQAEAERQKRIAARLAALQADYSPTPLLPVIAVLLDDAEHNRNVATRMRASGHANRLLRELQRKPEPPPMTLAEYERRKHGGAT